MKLLDVQRTLDPKWCQHEGEHHDWNDVLNQSVHWCSNCGALGILLGKSYMNIQFPGSKAHYNINYEEGELDHE